MPINEVVHRTGRDAPHIGFLSDGGERLLGHAGWLREAREVGALAQLGNAGLHRAPDLPETVAVSGARGGRMPTALLTKLHQSWDTTGDGSFHENADTW